MSKSTPAAPDYAGAAAQTAEGNQQTLEQQNWANRPTVNTPFGQQTWSTTPVWDSTSGQYINTWEQNTNLTPEAQGALDSQMRIGQGRSNLAEGALKGVGDTYSSPMDWSQFSDTADGPQAGNYHPEDVQRSLDTNGLQDVDSSQKYYGDAGDAIYNQWNSRADPQFTRDTDALRTQLYNQGLREGDQAFDREIQKQRESQGDARQQASYQATIGAGAEAQRMQGMDLGTRGQQFNERSQSGAFANSAADQALRQNMAAGGQNFDEGTAAANYQNTLRQQQIAEAQQRRGQGLNEVNALLNGQQVGLPQAPSFNQTGRSQGVDYSNVANQQYGAASDTYNAQQGQTQSALSAAAMAAMMFSDRKLKKNIRRVGTHDKGYALYRYEYKWEPPHAGHIGVMADEVDPKYVVRDSSGHLMVDYALLNA